MSLALQPASTCFTRQHGEVVAAACSLQLSDRDCAALAELLPVLICGEESAGLVFAKLSQAPSLLTAHNELAAIERDEHQHARLLMQLRRSLPTSRTDIALSRATRWFFLRMRERDLGRHFARIAALDSAVCILLGALRRRGTSIASEPFLAPLFARIHRDEARHVAVSRRHARNLLGTSQAHVIAVDTRAQLIDLLTLRTTELEQLLRSDADKLFMRLRNPSPALFA
jgi:hypothetical protein